MRAIKALGLVVLSASLGLAGCATDSSVPAATGIGAAGGALLGYGLTGSGLGAAAGAGAGALAGAVTGTVIDSSRRSSPSPQAYQAPPPQAYAPDPTRGEFINDTSWRVEVFLDNSGQPLQMAPGQRFPMNLDLGGHQVLAKAYVSTQYGERSVGSLSRDVYVDPRGSGWSLRFDERMF